MHLDLSAQEMSDERLFAENRKIVVNELSTCWRKFSEQELSAMNGKDELVSRVQLKYGFSKEQALRDVDALLRGRPTFENQWHFVRLERERLIMPDERPA